MLNIIVLGAVKSTEYTLRALIRHEMNVVGVLGQENKSDNSISGYTDLKPVAEKHSIPFKYFKRINDQENYEWIKKNDSDIIFAVGFSQLVKDDILNLPKKCCIGFHPTYLPRGRGRAPMAWMILKEKEGAATFFKMGKGADDGPIFAQRKFIIDESDYVEDVRRKILKSIDIALDNWLPNLKKGEWKPKIQDDTKATYYGKRSPEDGIIDWNLNNIDIHRLIRASSKPYPGAYTFFGKYKLFINKATPFTTNQLGVVGKVIEFKGENPIVQCGENHLEIEDYDIKDLNENIIDKKLKIGNSLGYNIEEILFELINSK